MLFNLFLTIITFFDMLMIRGEMQFQCRFFPINISIAFILTSSIRTLFYPKKPNTNNTQNNNSGVQLLNSVCRNTNFCVSVVMVDPLSLLQSICDD